MSFIRFATRAVAVSRQSWVAAPARTQPCLRARFSAAAGLSRDGIQTRVLDVLKGFEKVDPAKPHILPMTWVLIAWTQSKSLWQSRKSSQSKFLTPKPTKSQPFNKP
ncbi:hypothetical protein BDN72DRAFT_22939 [Pluteus cervinus]|uniref:Uncharacterized protein n=1 Tax=Pluteus cervinus TaxID=181527 RepID=A0ACD3BFX7_9AGAR|nr:hypothetical protein BDN72DRAFT_22939 [Pluteus cervinus]